MTKKDQNDTQTPKEAGARTLRRRKHVAENRADAQRAKLDAQAEAREQQKAQEATAATRKPNGKHDQRRLLTNRRANTTIAHAIDDYLQDHAGGNHSDKTLEWHSTALGLMQSYLEQERGITLVGEIDAPDISAWFAHMRTSPGGHGKPHSERTIQTYARSARAFFHRLVRRETIQSNPFDRVVFPKVGKPLIQTIEAEEFERLLVACTPSNESGSISDRAAARNRATLWVLYDTGIRISELCGLRLGDFDHKRGIYTPRVKYGCIATSCVVRNTKWRSESV
jgi:integrase